MSTTTILEIFKKRHVKFNVSILIHMYLKSCDTWQNNEE